MLNLKHAAILTVGISLAGAGTQALAKAKEKKAPEKPEMIEVESSKISAVGYDASNDNALTVVFTDGAETTHYDVPERVFDEFLTYRATMGGFYKGRIMDVYPTSKPGEETAKTKKKPKKEEVKEDEAADAAAADTAETKAEAAPVAAPPAPPPPPVAEEPPPPEVEETEAPAVPAAEPEALTEPAPEAPPAAEAEPAALEAAPPSDEPATPVEIPAPAVPAQEEVPPSEADVPVAASSPDAATVSAVEPAAQPKLRARLSIPEETAAPAAVEEAAAEALDLDFLQEPAAVEAVPEPAAEADPVP